MVSLSFLFSSTAASDHYLIGNNITVAVLGIVIPIGEYFLISRFLPACFSLLAPLSLLVAEVLHVECEWVFVFARRRVCVCDWVCCKFLFWD